LPRSKARKEAEPFTIFEAVVESLATGMAVLCLLDFVRIALGQDFHMALQRPCKVGSPAPNGCSVRCAVLLLLSETHL